MAEVGGLACRWLDDLLLGVLLLLNLLILSLLSLSRSHGRFDLLRLQLLYLGLCRHLLAPIFPLLCTLILLDILMIVILIICRDWSFIFNQVFVLNLGAVLLVSSVGDGPALWLDLLCVLVLIPLALCRLSGILRRCKFADCVFVVNKRPSTLLVITSAPLPCIHHFLDLLEHIPGPVIPYFLGLKELRLNVLGRHSRHHDGLGH